MNAQQAKEYAAANGFVISKTDDGKFNVMCKQSGMNVIRSRYDGCGAWMKEMVDTLKFDARIAAANEPEDNTPLLTKSADEVRAKYGSGMVDAIEDFAQVPDMREEVRSAFNTLQPPTNNVRFVPVVAFEDMSDASKNRVRAIAAEIRKHELSAFTFALRVTHKRSSNVWGSGFVLYFRTYKDAVKAARKELSGVGGKSIERAVIERVL